MTDANTLRNQLVQLLEQLEDVDKTQAPSWLNAEEANGLTMVSPML